MISGTIAEFEDVELFVRAARRLSELRCTGVEAYMPHPVPELDEVLAIGRTRLRWWVLAAGLLGVVLAYVVQRWCNAVDYPYLVGGRPYDSVPTDVPIMFETAVLFAGTTAFVAMLVVSGLPRLYSPILDVPGYERTSVDRFWLVVPTWSDDLARELDAHGAIAVRSLPEAP